MISSRGKRWLKSEDTSPGKKVKRHHTSGSDDENGKDMWILKPTADFPASSIYNCTSRSQPAELFRKDLISAMKLPDSEPLSSVDYWQISDPWKQEWEKGVQVPVNPEALPSPIVRVLRKKDKHKDYKLPKKYIRTTHDEFFSNDLHQMSNAPSQAEKTCRYDLDACDVHWLKIFNEERSSLGLQPVEELVMELLIEELEVQSHDNIQYAIQTEAGLGIEYDEDVICDVCRSPDSEEGNEMVFCDSCDICVHQACYGITTIPEGSWVCRTCALGTKPNCLLCPNKGGAMKSTRNGQKWAHVSCALWIPEVIIGCVEIMEPITKISHIPASRWALVCCLCREKTGACIQCSVKKCKTAYHVTCAFQHGLDMKTIVDDDAEDDGVKFRSYCPKHSKNQDDVLSSDSETSEVRKKKSKRKKKKTKFVNEIKREEKSNQRVLRLQQIESEFYNYVNMKDVIQNLSVDEEVADFIFNYWKLKRRSSFNKPLMSPKSQEAHIVDQDEDDSVYARMRMFVHLRQDLERVRNLCYMVSRREKLFLSWCKLREDIFQKQVALLTDNHNSFSEVEREKVIHAAHGKSVYDQFYSWDTSCCAKKARNHRKDEMTKSPSSQTKLPNPYAKTYFNGRSQRRSLMNSDADTSYVCKSDNELSDYKRVLSRASGNIPFVEKNTKADGKQVSENKDEPLNSDSKTPTRMISSDDKNAVNCDKDCITLNGTDESERLCESKQTEMCSKPLFSRGSSFISIDKSKPETRNNCISVNHCQTIDRQENSANIKQEKKITNSDIEEIEFNADNKLKDKENSRKRNESLRQLNYEKRISKRKSVSRSPEKEIVVKNKKSILKNAVAKKLFHENPSDCDASEEEKRDVFSNSCETEDKKCEKNKNGICRKIDEVRQNAAIRPKVCSANVSKKASPLHNKRLHKSCVNTDAKTETDVDVEDKSVRRIREIDKRKTYNNKDNKIVNNSLKKITDNSDGVLNKDFRQNQSPLQCSKNTKEETNIQKKDSLHNVCDKARVTCKEKPQKSSVCEPFFSPHCPSKSSLSGYRIPKKQKPEFEEKQCNGSVSDVKKTNGNILNCLALQMQSKESKGSDCETFSSLGPPDNNLHHVEIIDQENNRSPRIVIKLRKDPNYPESSRWQRDSDNTKQEFISLSSEHALRYPSKLENIWQEPESFQQQRLRREPSKYSMRTRTNTQDFYSQLSHSEPS